MKLTRRLVIALLIVSISIAYSDNNTDSHNITLTVPQIALLDIESAGSNDISITLLEPAEAGDPLASQTDNSLWLNVTSIVTSGASNDISVSIDQTVPGLDLKVVAAVYAGSGKGSWGTPNAEVTLTTGDQTLVGGITSGYTANGAGNGFQLTYTVDPDENAFDALVASSPIIEVTYTFAP
ncbi:hypothetical protein KKF86_02805 [bacterium]|nr:hypothetical protein [bacterium]